MKIRLCCQLWVWVISHGFMTNAFLPIRVAFPVIASVLYGPSSRTIPDHINVERTTLVCMRAPSC